MEIYVGLDLSKNHYGLTLFKEDKVFLYYVYIKPFTKTELKKLGNSITDSISVDEDITKDNLSFKKIKINVNPEINQIGLDALKSKNINSTIQTILKEHSHSNEDKIYVSLEDYIIINNGIVSLVHTTEQFKYDFLKEENRRLFLCCNASWKKLLGKEASKKPTGKDRYENLKNFIRTSHNDIHDFMVSLNQNDDVIKDLIDSWGLAMAWRHKDNPIFKVSYSKRIFNSY